MKRALAIAMIAGCHRAPPPHGLTATRIQAVTRGPIADRVLLTGELRAAAGTDLSVPRTTAWELVIRWMAPEGTAVKAGDRVLSFDNSAVTADLETKHLTALEAEMTLQTTHDVSAMETENKANALAQAQIALDKANVLAQVPADLLPAREAQDRQLNVKRTTVAVNKAKADLDAQQQAAALELRVKQIELDKSKRAIDASEAVIDALELAAPHDGVVVVGVNPWDDRKFHVGDSVQPGWVVLSLPDLEQTMDVFSELSDVDDGRVNIGMVGSCTLDAYPGEPMPCTVKQLTPVARSKGEQSLRRAFSVRLSLAKTDPRLRPGMSVKVELHRPGLASAVIVPRGAVMFGAKQATVRLAAGGLREVTLGPCDPQGCAIDNGLAEGDRVVIGDGK